MKEVAVIRVNSWFRGFFAELNILMCYLHNHPEAVVYADWRKRFYYADDKTNNWFKFFEEVPFQHGKDKLGSMRLKIVNVTKNYSYPTFTTSGAHSLHIDPVKPERVSGALLPYDWRNEFGEIYRNNIIIKDGINRRIEKFWSSHMDGEKVVGVHVRNFSGFTEKSQQGPTPCLQDYFSVIDSMDYDKVFLATDNVQVLNRFMEAYGDDLIFQEQVFRSKTSPDSKGSEIHKQHGYYPKAKRKDKSKIARHMGEEVLSDAILLSKCSDMVHGQSNVSTAVGYINPELEMHYLGDPALREECGL